MTLLNDARKLIKEYNKDCEPFFYNNDDSSFYKLIYHINKMILKSASVGIDETSVIVRNIKEPIKIVQHFGFIERLTSRAEEHENDILFTFSLNDDFKEDENKIAANEKIKLLHDTYDNIITGLQFEPR